MADLLDNGHKVIFTNEVDNEVNCFCQETFVAVNIRSQTCTCSYESNMCIFE